MIFSIERSGDGWSLETIKAGEIAFADVFLSKEGVLIVLRAMLVRVLRVKR